AEVALGAVYDALHVRGDRGGRVAGGTVLAADGRAHRERRAPTAGRRVVRRRPERLVVPRDRRLGPASGDPEYVLGATGSRDGAQVEAQGGLAHGGSRRDRTWAACEVEESVDALVRPGGAGYVDSRRSTGVGIG